MKLIKNLLFTALLCFSHSTFASPVQEKTLDDFFKVADLKQTTLNTLSDQDLKAIGKTKEEFWTLYEPEVRKIYKQILTEEEILASIQFYKSPEGHSVLIKTPELIKLCMEASLNIAFPGRAEFNKLFQNDADE